VLAVPHSSGTATDCSNIACIEEQQALASASFFGQQQALAWKLSRGISIEEYYIEESRNNI
jgi:hypothetical protein